MGFIKEFKKGLEGQPEGEAYAIAERQIVCPHCGCDRFWKRPAQLNTAGASFLNIDFANKTAYAYICVECGRIEWFEE